MQAKITKRSVDALRPGAKDIKLWDTEIAGFVAKITPRGKRVFQITYWPHRLPGVRRTYKIGDYGSPIIRARDGVESVRDLTADLAREIALEIRADIQRGGDPAGTKRDGRRRAQRETVEALSKDFLLEKKLKRKPSTAAEYARIFRKTLIPAFGAMPVSEVTVQKVEEIHHKLSKTPTQANRVVNVLSVFMSWCEVRKYLERGQNPCVDVELYPEHSRERFLTVEEIGKIGTALNTAATAGLPAAPELRRKPKKPDKQKHRPKSADKPIRANPFAIAAVRMLLLSGWREMEVLTIRWDMLDLERGSAVLPDTKTGKSPRSLGRDAVELLRALPRVDGSPYVFPGAKPGKPLREIKRLWGAVRHATGLTDVRLHDIRHTFASHAIGSGQSLYITGKLLGHARAETTRRYAHLADDVQKAAADEVARTIQAALTGSTADVVPITKQAARKRA